MAKRRQSDLKDPDLLGRLWQNLVLSGRLLLDRRVSGASKMLPLLVVLYILSPIDFLPELMLGPFGAVDDIGVLLLGLQMFINSAPSDVVAQHRGERPPDAPQEPQRRWFRRGKADDPQVIEGQYQVHDDEEF